MGTGLSPRRPDGEVDRSSPQPQERFVASGGYSQFVYTRLNPRQWPCAACGQLILRGEPIQVMITRGAGTNRVTHDPICLSLDERNRENQARALVRPVKDKEFARPRPSNRT